MNKSIMKVWRPSLLLSLSNSEPLTGLQAAAQLCEDMWFDLVLWKDQIGTSEKWKRAVVISYYDINPTSQALSLLFL